MSPSDRRQYQLAEAAAAAKPRDAWFTVLLVDHAAIRLTWLFANRLPVTPTQLTAAWGMLTAASAGAFLVGTVIGRLAGAGLFLLAFLLDCVDGKLAWLTGRTTEAGRWLDSVLSRVSFVGCALALLAGQYETHGRTVFLKLALIVVSAELIRQIMERFRPPFRIPAPGMRRPFGAWHDVLAARGLRARPVSEVEFAIAVCVVAPLTGWYAPVITITAPLVVLFELVAGCAPWLTVRSEPAGGCPIEAILPMPSPLLPPAPRPVQPGVQPSVPSSASCPVPSSPPPSVPAYGPVHGPVQTWRAPQGR